MRGDRRLRILARLAERDQVQAGTSRLCQVCAESTGTTGAGIMLMSGEVSRGSLCTTDEVSALIERLQFDLGEGPCIDAHNGGAPVLEPDLGDPVAPRWPAFGGPAFAAGARAVFGFPLRVGAVRLGALNLYCDAAGPLTDDQHADALVMADVAAEAVLDIQSAAPVGRIAFELEAAADFRYGVHQAAGMVAAQMERGVAEALIVLRAHAYGSGTPLSDIAAAVIGRTLRFQAGGTATAEGDRS